MLLCLFKPFLFLSFVIIKKKKREKKNGWAKLSLSEGVQCRLHVVKPNQRNRSGQSEQEKISQVTIGNPCQMYDLRAQENLHDPVAIGFISYWDWWRG